jgi:hypothetical protein
VAGTFSTGEPGRKTRLQTIHGQCLGCSYHMTLSALAGTFGGIDIPICFAVFKINHQLELSRLFHGQVRRLRAFKDFVHVSGGAAVQVGTVSAISRETTRLSKFRCRLTAVCA